MSNKTNLIDLKSKLRGMRHRAMGDVPPMHEFPPIARFWGQSIAIPEYPLFVGDIFISEKTINIHSHKQHIELNMDMRHILFIYDLHLSKKHVLFIGARTKNDVNPIIYIAIVYKTSERSTINVDYTVLSEYNDEKYNKITMSGNIGELFSCLLKKLTNIDIFKEKQGQIAFSSAKCLYINDLTNESYHGYLFILPDGLFFLSQKKKSIFLQTRVIRDLDLVEENNWFEILIMSHSEQCYCFSEIPIEKNLLQLKRFMKRLNIAYNNNNNNNNNNNDDNDNDDILQKQYNDDNDVVIKSGMDRIQLDECANTLQQQLQEQLQLALAYRSNSEKKIDFYCDNIDEKIKKLERMKYIAKEKKKLIAREYERCVLQMENEYTSAMDRYENKMLNNEL